MWTANGTIALQTPLTPPSPTPPSLHRYHNLGLAVAATLEVPAVKEAQPAFGSGYLRLGAGGADGYGAVELSETRRCCHNDFTMEMSVRVPKQERGAGGGGDGGGGDGDDGVMPLVTKSDGKGHSGFQLSVVRETNSLRLTAFSVEEGETVWESRANCVEGGHWYTVWVMYRQANNYEAEFWVDGVQVGKEQRETRIISNNEDCVLGGQNTPSGQKGGGNAVTFTPRNGHTDPRVLSDNTWGFSDLRFWGYARSKDECEGVIKRRDMYGGEGNLKGCWKFGSGAGSYVGDASTVRPTRVGRLQGSHDWVTFRPVTPVAEETVESDFTNVGGTALGNLFDDGGGDGGGAAEVKNAVSEQQAAAEKTGGAEQTAAGASSATTEGKEGETKEGDGAKDLETKEAQGEDTAEGSSNVDPVDPADPAQPIGALAALVSLLESMARVAIGHMQADVVERSGQGIGMTVAVPAISIKPHLLTFLLLHSIIRQIYGRFIGDHSGNAGSSLAGTAASACLGLRALVASLQLVRVNLRHLAHAGVSPSTVGLGRNLFKTNFEQILVRGVLVVTLPGVHVCMWVEWSNVTLY